MPSAESNAPGALVTGASGALGAAVTAALLDAGYRVAAVARGLRQPPSDSFFPLNADLSTRMGAVFAVSHAREALGGIDAIVHLAGGFSAAGTIADTPEAVWDRMLTMNLHMARHLLAAGIPVVRNSSRGRIVVAGSRAGVDPPAGMCAYAASKAALHALVQVAAAELKDSGVTVNAVLPGIIDTPANREEMGESAAELWVKPANIASLIVWLCSPEARDVTGALLPVYGRL